MRTHTIKSPRKSQQPKTGTTQFPGGNIFEIIPGVRPKCERLSFCVIECVSSDFPGKEQFNQKFPGKFLWMETGKFSIRFLSKPALDLILDMTELSDSYQDLCVIRFSINELYTILTHFRINVCIISYSKLWNWLHFAIRNFIWLNLETAHVPLGSICT